MTDLTEAERRIVEWLHWKNSQEPNHTYYGHIAWLLKKGDHMLPSAAFEEWKLRGDHRQEKE